MSRALESTRSLTVVGGTLALLAALTVAQPPAASAVDSTTDLGVSLATVGLDHEKGGDTAAGGGKIFVSGRDRIVVLDGRGTVTGEITGLSGAVGLAMAADGARLYAALSGSNQIAEIDTGTLAITRRIDLAYPCPMNLALSGSQLLVGYGCERLSGGGVLSLDLTAPAPQAVSVRAGMSSGAPLVAAARNTLVFALPNLLPAYLYVYDLDGTSATPRGGIDGLAHGLSGPYDLAVTPDGSTLVAALDSPDQIDAWDTTTLTRVRSYSPIHSISRRAVAVSPDGTQVVGTGVANVVSYDAATAEITYRSENSSLGSVVPGSLTISGADVLTVLRAGTGRLHLWRMHGALLPRSSMTLTAPATGDVLEPVTLTGGLALPGGLDAGAQPVVVTRHAPDGTSATVAEVTTAADGSFTLADTPPVGGAITYQAVWDGSQDARWSSASATTEVARRPATLTLTGLKTGSVGKEMRFRGTLAGDGGLRPEGAVITVERTWVDSSATRPLPSVTVDESGSFEFVTTVGARGLYRFTVRWPGNGVYQQAQASHEVQVS
ncbi:hypothetical protein [Nonomuraea sp. KM90]|uniref:hypothetical protein n=1 Tax=Nonomuraea sp. KM90 TaxID=3457428 RepID=UPI003FCC7C57